MSDILVRGMRMPQNCIDCRLSDRLIDNECPFISIDKRDYRHKRYEKCPLVELPAHGNLIDRDAEQLKNKLKLIREAEVQIYGRGSWGFAIKAKDAIYDASVIIPAESDGEA